MPNQISVYQEYGCSRRGMVGFWSNGQWRTRAGLDHGCIHGYNYLDSTYPPHRAWEYRTMDVIENWMLEARYWVGHAYNRPRGDTKLIRDFCEQIK